MKKKYIQTKVFKSQINSYEKDYYYVISDGHSNNEIFLYKGLSSYGSTYRDDGNVSQLLTNIFCDI